MNLHMAMHTYVMELEQPSFFALIELAVTIFHKLS